MAQLLTPETFEFFARYLLAGYVVIFVRSAFVLGLRPKPAEILIEAVILSLVVQLLAYAVAELHRILFLGDWAHTVFPTFVAFPPEPFIFAVRVLIIPAFLGACLGYFLKSGFRGGVLRRLSLPVVHPVRRAHDFAFGHERAPGLVEVTFEDGTKIGGWFGPSSLASTDDNRSDLYLERSYVIDDDGNWKDPTEPRAILISLRNVRSIEFLLEREDQYG